MRLVLHLLRQDTATVEAFGNAIITLKREVKYCKVCHNISDTDICQICSNPSRDASVVCVVENIRDVMAVEATQQFKGLYHVLGGVISPMDGIGPSDLQIESLVHRVEEGEVKEVVLALSSTMEGDTTNFYIFRKLAKTNVKMSVIARGISIGDELEYTDEVTLGRSRQSYALHRKYLIIHLPTYSLSRQHILCEGYHVLRHTIFQRVIYPRSFLL